jgi:hypothetical protein
MDLDISLVYHLVCNHYPPVSTDFIDSAKLAIKAANEGDYDGLIELPNGITLTVQEIIEGLHLESYLDDLVEVVEEGEA